MVWDSGWKGRVLSTYRPDAVVDPDFPGFADNIARLGQMTGEDTAQWAGYLAAHRNRRAAFKALGATATDHGHPSARTEDLPQAQAAALYARILSGDFTAEDADAFRGQMLTEMARMSLDDGLVMQIHAGSRRNQHAGVFEQFGRDKGFDIPGPTDFVAALRPLLFSVGMEPGLRIILFTQDEATFARSRVEDEKRQSWRNQASYCLPAQAETGRSPCTTC